MRKPNRRSYRSDTIVSMPSDKITVRGAREHNLKSLNVEIPRHKLVVITGLSGSGKSSLAFDTIYAEEQRRYVESLSAYARQFLEQMEKPDVDLIEGLSPAISIEQKTTGSNPRSTVGTVTEIYDYMRLLFANIGVPHCPNCGKEISSQSLERIADMVMLYPQDERINVMAPLVRGRKGEFKKELAALWTKGDKKFIKDALQGLSRDFGIDLNAPFSKLPRKQREVLLFGSGKQFEGLIPNLRRRFEEGSWAQQEELEPYRSLRPCPTCHGRRLKLQSLSVKVKGRSMSDYVNLPISEALELVDNLTLTDREAIIAEPI